MEHRVTPYAARSRVWSSDLGCQVSRVIGYGWSCSCGVKGRLRPTLAEARAESRAHRESGPES